MQNDYTDEPWVRCKDCKYLIKDVAIDGEPLYACDRMYDKYSNELEVDLDDFCSWGMRRDDD